MKAELRALLDRVQARRPGFPTRSRDLFEVQPVMTDQDAPVVRPRRVRSSGCWGRWRITWCSPGTYDQKHIDRIGRLRIASPMGRGCCICASAR